MHLGIYELISFKLGIMIDTSKLYRQLEWWYWPCFKVTVVLESRIFCVPFVVNVCIKLAEIGYAAMTCWSVQAHVHFCVVWLIFKGENSTLATISRLYLRLACIHMLCFNFFQIGYDERHNWTQHCETSVNGLDLHRVSEGRNLCSQVVLQRPEVAQSVTVVSCVTGCFTEAWSGPASHCGQLFYRGLKWPR